MTVTFTSDENRTLLSYYAVSSGNFLSTFWDNLSIPSSGVKNQKGIGFSTPEDETDKLAQTVSKKLPLLAV